MSREPASGEVDTRSRVLDAVREEILDTGGGFATSKVAKRAGVSRQTVYLHFPDRTALLLGLVQHLSERVDLTAQLDWAWRAKSGIDALERIIQVAADIAPQLDPVLRAFEAAKDQDDAVADVWRRTLNGRRLDHRRVIERLHDEGNLADRWTIDTATDFLYSATLPAQWRELVGRLGWTTEAYVAALQRSLHLSLVAG